MIDPEDAPKIRPREKRHDSPSTWSRAEVVTRAKCQAHPAGCRNLVDVTAEGLGMLETLSAQLVRRGEAPLDLNGCFPCPDCYAKRAAAAEDKSAERRAKNTEAIRYLKAAGQSQLDEADENIRAGRIGAAMPPRTSDAVAACMTRMAYLAKTLGGGHVTDLLLAIREGRRTGKAKTRRDDL